MKKKIGRTLTFTTTGESRQAIEDGIEELLRINIPTDRITSVLINRCVVRAMPHVIAEMTGGSSGNGRSRRR